MSKSRVVKIGLFLISLLVSLCLADLFIFYKFHPKKRSGKGVFNTPIGLMYCYPTNPDNRFPLRASEDDDLKKIQRLVTSPELERIVSLTPYCITYDELRRRAGFFEERSKAILMIGDSFVFGEGIVEKDTLGYQLGEACPKYNFHNYGQQGFGVREILDKLKRSIDSLPKVSHVVYLLNLNDFLLSAELVRRQNKLIDFQLVRWEEPIDRVEYFPAFLLKTNIGTLLHQTIAMRRDTSSTIDLYNDTFLSADNLSFRKESFSIIKEMEQESLKRKASFQVVIYPLLYKRFDGTYPFKKAHQSILNDCQSRGIDCLDALPAFDGYSSFKPFIVHPLDYHPNEDANRLVVKYLTEENERFKCH